jgi:putative ABC transport system permease protein
MKFTETFLSGMKSISSHKLRSFLTILGIIIGVAAVATMFSSVEVMKNLVEDAISSIGYDNTIVLYSSFPSEEENKLKKYPAPPRFKYITYRDYEVLKKELPYVQTVYAATSDLKNAYINGQTTTLNLQGVETPFFINKNYIIEEGRFFTQYEEENGIAVCILGSRLAERFFPDGNPVGQFVTIGDIRMRIIGVLKSDIYSSGGEIQANPWERQRDHESCFIPTKCVAKYLRPNFRVDNIWIRAVDSEKVGTVYNRARQILFALHNTADDVELQDINQQMLEVREQIDEQMQNWNIILGIIAGISLFTGGIGLFSILLISIRERMKEIGIRKSIGAKDADIFAYFIIESIVLALAGGLIGAGLSFGLVSILATQIQYEVSVPIIGIVIGLAFAIGVGLISGIYPAYKASKINPITAIFYTD